MGIVMNRREFLFGLSSKPQAFVALRLQVLEVFNLSGRCILLVHHADPGTRSDVAVWLRANSGSRVRYTTPAGTTGAARLFRAGMCFGRGLLAAEGELDIRVKDVITVAF